MKINQANILLEAHMRELKLEYSPEFRFHPTRRWRFDYAICVGDLKVAIEIQGATWIKGRHSTGSGIQGDMEKFREAAKRGWYVVPFSTLDVLNGTAREFLRSWLRPLKGFR